jgi:two-component system, NtrC family, sensor histidine kinase HydH
MNLPTFSRPRTALEKPRHFNLSRWFAIAALLSIAALATVIGLLLNAFLTERMVTQEAALTQEFVNSLLIVETPLVRYIADPALRRETQAPESFAHLSSVPDMLRANLYDRRQELIWSSDPALIGRKFDRNPELDRALTGELMAKREEHEDEHEGKPEHQALPERDAMFVEIYVPVRDAATGQVVGAIEFYKRPRALARALSQLRMYIAFGAVVGGGLLFAALYGLVRRADATIREQQRLLVDQATLAALGEMSGAVAHGIRNPLASIRSSAELMQDGPPEEARGAAQDIVAQSDRLEAWVRELLAYTQPLDDAAEPVLLGPLVQRCLDDFAREFERRRIDVRQQLPGDLPAVRGDAMLLSQVLRTLMSNAVEVLGSSGGRIDVRGQAEGSNSRSVLLEVHDSGPGMTAEQLARVGRPFYTTKARGLGVGLAMARRVIERAGGRLAIDSAPGRGTTVRLHLVAAQRTSR